MMDLGLHHQELLKRHCPQMMEIDHQAIAYLLDLLQFNLEHFYLVSFLLNPSLVR